MAEGLAAWDVGDPAAALDRLRPAAAAGDADAQFLVGLAYTTGRGVARDPEAGVEWFRRAALQDHREALFMLGLALERGRGVPIDLTAARGRYRQAAAQGHGGAHYRLGRMDIRSGQVAVGLDHMQAAAEIGHPEAQAVLGDAYSTGLGVAPSDAWAVRWLGSAARQGVAEAQYRLGAHHVAGRGVPEDAVRGLAWIQLAADQGYAPARPTAQALAERLGPGRTADARRLARRLDAEPAGMAEVRFVQYALRQAGYSPGPVDGVLGRATRDALQKYQQARGLTVDGRIGPQTLAALRGERAI